MKHPSIKLELALPDPNRYLPIFDLKMKNNEDGSLSLKHYRKPANRGVKPCTNELLSLATFRPTRFSADSANAIDRCLESFTHENV